MIALLVFDFRMDPDTVERMTLSRLTTYIDLKLALDKERKNLRGSK
jgi:hypothetical protein